MNWKAIGQWIENFLEAIVYGDRSTITYDYIIPSSMTPEPTQPVTPEPPQPKLIPPVNARVAQVYLWNTPEQVRHSIRVICDEEGLTVEQKNHLSATVHCESGYKNIVHPNMVNGKVSTTDFGFFQINDYWHIGPGKDFPSSDFVLNNPETVCRWMCRQWKAGNARAWVCWAKQLSLHYTA